MKRKEKDSVREYEDYDDIRVALYKADKAKIFIKDGQVKESMGKTIDNKIMLKTTVRGTTNEDPTLLLNVFLKFSLHTTASKSILLTGLGGGKFA